MPPGPNPRAYQAIDLKDKTRRESLELRLRDGRRYWLKHAERHLMAPSPDQTALTLSFYAMSVIIRGRNLAETATAIDDRNTPPLCEHDAGKCDMPAAGEPVMESMAPYRPKAGENERRHPGVSASPAAARKQPPSRVAHFMVGFAHTMASLFKDMINIIFINNVTTNTLLKAGCIIAPIIIYSIESHAETQKIYVDYDAGKDIDIIIGDVYPEVAPDYTYFATIAWWGGYCGIQYLPDNISRVIFSQFQPQRDGYAAALSLADGGKLKRPDEGQENADFHSNAISYTNDLRKLPVKQWYRFVVRSWDDEVNKGFSQIGLWTQDQSGEWTHQATFVLPGQHVPLSQPGSFVEDWTRDGKMRRGVFRRLLLHHAAGGWERLPPIPRIQTIPLGSPDNRYNASPVKGGFSLQIGEGTATSDLRQAMDIQGDASASTETDAKIINTSINPDTTTTNNFYIHWDFKSNSPQFYFKVDLFADNKCEGSELAHTEGYDSEVRYVTLPARRSTAEGLYAKYTISDIYGNTDTACFSASGK